MKKVFFGIPGQYGDIVMQEPALRKYISENPDDKIILGASIRYADALMLYKGYHPNVTTLKVCNSYNDFPTEDDLRYFENEKIDYFPMADSEKVSESDRGKLFLHSENDWVEKRHQVAETALQLGVNIDTNNVEDLKINLGQRLSTTDKIACISPFPSFPQEGIKSLSAEQIVISVKVLSEMGYNVVHLNGPNEPDIPGTVKANRNWFGSTQVLRHADIYVGGDTGMSWVSSGYNIPTLGIYAWGYHNPSTKTSKNWQPVNPNAIYLEDQAASAVKIKDIVVNLVKLGENITRGVE